MSRQHAILTYDHASGGVLLTDNKSGGPRAKGERGGAHSRVCIMRVCVCTGGCGPHIVLLPPKGAE